MRVDAQTLRELGLFSAAEDGTPLFESFRRTLTQGGDRRLRHRFEHPLDDLGEIRKVQDALRELMRSPLDWQPALSGQQERQIEAYFLSGIEVISAGWRPLAFVQGLRQTFVNRHFAPLEAGVHACWRALRDLRELWLRQRTCPKPALLAGIWEQLEEAFAHRALQPLWRSRPGLSFSDIFLFDRILRETCLQEVRQLMRLSFELDALGSMARLCVERNFCFPSFSETDEPRLVVRGLIHPSLAKPVANSLELAGETRFLMLTGPNMGGKTTLLKACALAVYLAHLGMGVPARSMELSRFDALLTSLQNLDSLELGYSYFYSEVRRVKQAAELVNSGQRVLLLFDELFRGTNLQDAYDASLAIIRRLCLQCRTLGLLSTHLLELIPQLTDLPGLQFACFRVQVRDRGFDFDYQLHAGVSEHKIGLAILQQEGVLELLDAAAEPPVVG